MGTFLVEKCVARGAFDRIGVPVTATSAAEDGRAGGWAHVEGGAFVVGQQLLVVVLATSHVLFAVTAYLVVLFTYLVFYQHLLEQQVVEVLSVLILTVHLLL